MSNSLDPDQGRRFVGPDLVPNCLQRSLSDDTNRQRSVFVFNVCSTHARIQSGDKGSGLHPEKSQNIGFSSSTGPDPLKNHKDTKPAFIVWLSSARQRNVI